MNPETRRTLDKLFALATYWKLTFQDSGKKRKCVQCHETKSLYQFPLSNRNENQYMWTCIACRDAKRKEFKNGGKITCKSCGKEKSLNQFGKNDQHWTGYQLMCKPCFAEYYRQKYHEKKERKSHG